MVKRKAHPWGAARILLAALLLTYAWRLQDLFTALNHAKPLALLSGAFLLVLFLDRRLPSEFLKVALRPPALFGVILGVLALAGIPFSIYPGRSFDIALKTLVPNIILMIAVAAAIVYAIDAYRLAAVHVIGGLIFSVFVLTHFKVGADGRLGSLVYFDANDLGLVLVCTLPLAEWFIHNAVNRWARLGALGVVGVFLLTIVKTGSRGAFLGLVVVVAYGVFVNRSAPLRRRLSLGALAALLLVGAAGTTYWTTMNTILHPTDDYNWVGNAQYGRMDVWRRGIGYMLGHPVMGVGVGDFPTAEGTLSPLARRQEYGQGVKWSVAHNSFLEVGAELGFPGLAAFLALLFGTVLLVRRGVPLGLAADDRRAAGMADALAASLLGYAVSGFFLSAGYSAFAYSLLGIAIGMHGVLERQASEAVPDLPAVPPPVAVGHTTPEWSGSFTFGPGDGFPPDRGYLGG